MKRKYNINSLINSYYEAALVKGTFEYYMFYEREEETGFMDEEVVKTIHTAISYLLSRDIKGQEIIQTIEELRLKIIEKMQVLTAYTDRLQIYEYVLNRLEQRFGEEEAIDEDIFINKLVEYIFSQKDHVVVNERIKEMLGQLPVRMTKNRYFDLIRESIALYKGSNKESLDSYVYMLRTSTMLYEPNGIKEYFPEFKERLQEFETTEYSLLTKETYHQLTHSLSELAEDLTKKSDFYVSAQELLNSLETIFLSLFSMEKEEWKKESVCKEILFFIQEQFKNSSNRNDLIQIENLLIQLEGEQETLQEKIARLEGQIADESDVKSENLMLNLEKMGKLMSSSIFVELDKKENTELVDDVYVKVVTKQLLEELVLLFQKEQKQVRHAVMASTLNKMPVFFRKAEEVVDYIKNSLYQCSDFSEKNVSMKLLQEIMNVM